MHQPLNIVRRGSYKDFFIEECLKISFLEQVSILFNGVFSFTWKAHRLLVELNRFARTRGYPARVDSSDKQILGAVHAIASLLARTSAAQGNSYKSSDVDNAAVVYSAITMIDAWIDSGHKPLSYKIKYIERARDVLVGGIDVARNHADVMLLEKHALLLIYAHETLKHASGWHDFIADFERLVCSGHREFKAQSRSDCIRSAILIGAYSAAAIYNVLFIDLLIKKDPLKRLAMRQGAIMNLVDDIFDYSVDIRAGRNTFVTVSASIEVGQELGYRTCVKLWQHCEQVSTTRQLTPMRNTIATWWIRNRYLSGDLTFRELKTLFGSDCRAVNARS